MIKYFYHGTSTHYMPQINQTGLPASLSGFGQTQLSGVGLTESLTVATDYAKSTAKSTTSQPVVLVVEADGSWADLRGIKLPDEIYDLEAAKEGVDPDNMQEFRKWFRPFNKEKHPLALAHIMMEKGYDGAIIDSTIKKGGDPEYVYFWPDKLNIVDEIYLEKRFQA
jgi:hypothetical protein